MFIYIYIYIYIYIWILSCTSFLANCIVVRKIAFAEHSTTYIVSKRGLDSSVTWGFYASRTTALHSLMSCELYPFVARKLWNFTSSVNSVQITAITICNVNIRFICYFLGKKPLKLCFTFVNSSKPLITVCHFYDVIHLVDGTSSWSCVNAAYRNTELHDCRCIRALPDCKCMKLVGVFVHFQPWRVNCHLKKCLHYLAANRISAFLLIFC